MAEPPEPAIIGRALIIDDFNLSRKNTRYVLKELGIEVFEASDGISGIAQYKTLRPDLVLLDLVMPGLDGIAVLSDLRRFDSNARIVVATADRQNLTAQDAKARGAAGFINKPLRLPALREVVEYIREGRDAWELWERQRGRDNYP